MSSMHTAQFVSEQHNLRLARAEQQRLARTARSARSVKPPAAQRALPRVRFRVPFLLRSRAAARPA